tara:strand:- start:426 stop:1298 length:873 start_codon:yes stop_codon:yes gene_type:complete
MNSDFAVLVLGSVQDGGYPHIGCKKACCQHAWKDTSKRRLVCSLAIIDKSLNECWIIDASPDIKHQINMVSDFLKIESVPKIKGIFLTHAHTGHYSGLLDLGKEALNASEISLYSMPQMSDFIKSNSAFQFLINSKNISLKLIENGQSIYLSGSVSIAPFLVPHRNEMSETVGYCIKSQNKSVIYLPDIDSWEIWDKDIVSLVRDNDYLFIDGTFYSENEILDRNIDEIPHPFIINTLGNLSILNKKERSKVFFTHLNHTNPVIQDSSTVKQKLISDGYRIAEEAQSFQI